MKLLVHAGVIAALLAVFLGLPAAYYLRTDAAAGGTDAVTSATIELPDQPSGEFFVILNRSLHSRTEEEWTQFFREEPVGVIMEDISCMTVSMDPSGVQLAQRYQARLAENQMELIREDGLLVLSRGETGRYDLIILSREMAEAMDFSAVCARADAAVIEIGGDDS